jgi:integrase
MKHGEISAGTVYSKVIGGKKKPKRTVWFLDYYVDGRRVRKASRASSKTEAWQMLKAVTTDLDRMEKGLPQRKDYRLRDVVDEYIAFKEKTGKRSTKRMRIALDHLADHLGDLYLGRINSAHLEAYRAARRKETGRLKDSKVSHTTINLEMIMLKSLYNVMRRRLKKFSGENPVNEIDLFPEQPRVHKILTKDEWWRLLEASDPRLVPILWVAVATGLRKNDVLRLRWKNIDFEENTLKAFVSKTQKWMAFNLGERLRSELQKIPRLHEDIVFYNPVTKKAYGNVKTWFAEAKMKAGLDGENFVFHDLRANAGTRAAQKTGSGLVAKELLGHASLKQTEDYLNLTPDYMKVGTQAVDDFFSRASERTPNGHQDSAIDSQFIH